MNPELLVSKAKARKGVLPAPEVLQIANYAASLRQLARTLTEAYLASEEYALRGGSREACAAALEKADDEIEAWAQSAYGDGWRDLRPVGELEPRTPAASAASPGPEPQAAGPAASTPPCDRQLPTGSIPGPSGARSPATLLG